MTKGMAKELIDSGLVDDDRYAADPEGESMLAYDMGLVCRAGCGKEHGHPKDGPCEGDGSW